MSPNQPDSVKQKGSWKKTHVVIHIEKKIKIKLTKITNSDCVYQERSEKMADIREAAEENIFRSDVRDYSNQTRLLERKTETLVF